MIEPARGLQLRCAICSFPIAFGEATLKRKPGGYRVHLDCVVRKRKAIPQTPRVSRRGSA